MVLNVVLKSTHENEHDKQAANFAQEKLLHKPRPFGLSVSCNLKSLRYCQCVYIALIGTSFATSFEKSELQKDRHTYRQTDRQTDIQTDMQTDYHMPSAHMHQDITREWCLIQNLFVP